MHASRRACVVLAALLAGCGIADAADRAHHARGSIIAISPQQITVSSFTGANATFTITSDTRYTAEKMLTLSAIQPGSYIGSAAVPGSQGTLTALEVTVFPPVMKGTGEGHYGWDLAPHSSMTNGTVGTLKQTNGDVLTVNYHGGTQTIVVPPGTPIVTFGPGAYSALQPGLKVVIFPSTINPHIAARIAYGLDGISPPQ